MRQGGAEAPDAGTIPVANLTAAHFENSSQRCDVVMKGGVTSGIVYPSAILRIAQRFTLKNIGGTSAGAIAAAVAAAAEYRRQSNKTGDGYMKIKTQVMDWLSRAGKMQSLFVPVILAWPLFHAFLWVISLGSARRRFTLSGALNLTLTALVGVFAAVGFLEALVQRQVPVIGVAAQFVAMIVILLIVIAALWILFVLPANNFGMCSGGKAWTLPWSAEPLTFWMSRQIDDLADMPAETPLTFAHLQEVGVNLEMVTTCLTMGRPFRIPFEYDLFYFRPDEFRRCFPPYIVKWLEQNGRAPKEGDKHSAARHEYLKKKGYFPLPERWDLPIVVAARMSLSFPLLLSAIRLYAIDYSLQRNEALPDQPQIEACWFSDGGLSSNFPISFFDGPLPSWPTLAITLEGFPRDVSESDPAEGAAMATNNNAEIGSTWTRLTDTPGFYGAIVNAMQNWQDTMQSEAPGFRDRIAHIRLSSQEGGVNLTMPASVIRTLLARGERAGELLVNHFQIPIPPKPFIMSWENHRWIRLRTTLDVMQRYAEDFRKGWNDPAKPAYAGLIANGMSPSSDSYKLSYPSQVRSAAQASQDVVDIADVTDPENASLSGKEAHAPYPVSDLRARPRY